MDGFKLFSKGLKKQSQAVPHVTKAAATPALQTAQEKPTMSTGQKFGDLGLGQFLVDGLKQLSIMQPTAVQVACVPAILKGKNVIACAKTGSGKTLAFALPIIHQLSVDPYGVYAIVLTPTRELAYQIGEQFKAVGESLRLRISVVVGGVDMQRQVIELKRRPHIVIATPGRLADCITSCSDAVHFDKIRFLVLDEADRLFEDTFAPDLEVIMSRLSTSKAVKRQTLLFSATISDTIKEAHQSDTFVYQADNKTRHDSVEKINQQYVLIPSLVRDAHLVYFLRSLKEHQTAIVFVGKCKNCELLRVMLQQLNLQVCALHSKLTQQQRTSSLAMFRSGVCRILLATDVASRGLDIPDVHLVVNYDVPQCATDYVHRIGRTARAGKGGTALTLASERDIDLLENIETKVGKKLTLREDVPESEINDMLQSVVVKRKEAMLLLASVGFGEREVINATKKLSDTELRASRKRYQRVTK